jgi:phosphomannomutase
LRLGCAPLNEFIRFMTDTLITSVSGVRGIVGKDLTPELVARYGAAFGTIARASASRAVVLARDARTSGKMFAGAVTAGLQSVGMDVVDCGLVPTPTAQLAVEHHRAAGGIVITASHNPVEWNALKFIGADGMFLDRATADHLFTLVGTGDQPRAGWDGIGSLSADADAVERHIRAVLALRLVDVDRIRARRFKVALDCVRGAGGTIMPALLAELGCEVVAMDTEMDGRFPRPPEPVPENLTGLSALVGRTGADLGIAVDPDVDRLAVVDEHGTAVGEDYTLALAVRAVLAQQAGPVAVNLSTSLVVEDAARAYGIAVERAPVGEANVARAIERLGAVIGGEGNGGVMLPALHIGRDAPVAAALVLELLARTGQSIATIVSGAPRYAIVKTKVGRQGDLQGLYDGLEGRFPDAAVDRQDGLRLGWEDSWLHVRPSGTEPIVRLIAEARTETAARQLLEAAGQILEA